MYVAAAVTRDHIVTLNYDKLKIQGHQADRG
jgi:hypothetical protein